MADWEYAQLQTFFSQQQLLQQHSQQLAKYPGTGGTEEHGAQTAGGTYTSNEQKMLQTLWNMARSAGLIA